MSSSTNECQDPRRMLHNLKYMSEPEREQFIVGLSHSLVKPILKYALEDIDLLQYDYLLAAISSPSNADDVQYRLLQKFGSFASAAARETAHGSNLTFTETNWPGGAHTGGVSLKIEEEDSEEGKEKAITGLHTIPLQDDKTLMTSNNRGNSIPLGGGYEPHTFIKHDHSTLQDGYLMSVPSAPALSSTPSFPPWNPSQYNNTITSTLTSSEPLTPPPSPARKCPRLMILIPPNGSLRPLDDLPLIVDVELRTRFVHLFRCNPACLRQFGSMIRNPESQLASDSCIPSILVDIASTYRNGGQHQVSADDACARRGHPCAHIRFHEGDHVLVFVPLSERLRGEAGWQELRFWVLGS